MGVYIKGMKMPSCNDCPLAGDFKCNLMPSIPALCKEYDIAVQNGKRLNSCPLIEIPLHGDLIDREELEHIIAQFNLNWEYGEGVSDCWDALLDAPTIIGSEREDD